MSFRFSLLLAATLLYTGIAVASPTASDSATGSSGSASAGVSSKAIAGLESSKGVLGILGASGAFAAASMALHNHSAREPLNVAPEISTSGTLSGLILLVGGVLIVRGRRRTQA